MKPGYVYMWEYVVAPDKVGEFERAQFVEAFEDLDARCSDLTTRETELGTFEPVGSGTT